ncbi:MAG: sulfatase-like hydrolase/transferase [Carboxylicivirga sp.]|jgi:choline-sulfatase|nr:sulfatase-like hydrolase/transferase [Carboxylicivirga sp.]
MYRNTKYLIILLFLLFAIQVKSLGQDKPNFLVIITDDQTYESIGSVNNPEVHTPNIDKLVEQGAMFSHCFNQGSWSGAVCIASRTMLHTGQSVFNAPCNQSYLPRRDKKFNQQETEVTLWGEIFRTNGYQTYMTGKWHNSNYSALKSFDIAKSIGKGMYSSFDKNGSTKKAYNRESTESEWKPWDRNMAGHWSPIVKDIITNEKGDKTVSKPYQVFEHTSELFSNNAIDYLMNRGSEARQPFFMYVSFNAPHDPRQSPKEYVDKYPNANMQIPVNYLPEHPFDQGDHEVRDEQLAPFPRTREAEQLHRSEYYAIISHFDYEMGRILDALEKSGQKDNTYIIFTSDHGLAVGQHGLMGKQNQYDHSIRMPLIMVGPGIEPGKKIEQQVYMQSIYPTTCELAGINVPETVQFNSLCELLHSDQATGEAYIFGCYKDFQRMIRSRDYKLIAYPHINRYQLFNLKSDPHEMNNLYGKKKYRKIEKQLLKQLKNKQAELNDHLKLN